MVPEWSAPGLSRPTSLRDKLGISLTVNGEKRQSSNTSDLILIATAGELYFDLHDAQARDIIFTGTPSGVISGYPQTTCVVETG